MVSKLQNCSSRLLIISLSLPMKNDLGREDFCVVGLPVRCQNDSDLPGSPTACGEGCWQWIIWVLWVVGRALVGFRCIPCEPDQALGSTMSALFLAAL